MSQTPGLGDLVAFLTARLDEDEEFAREANQSPWVCEDNFVENRDGGTIARFEIKANARHAAWNDPARVLREVAAKRAIVAEHGAASDPCDAFDASLRTIPCDTLLALAAVYSDYPDHRQEWASGDD